MITTKITIKNHLAEYVKGRYGGCEDKAVSFPPGSDLYVALWDLLQRRPKDAAIDTGNLEINLPVRSVGKRPETFNYLPKRGVSILEKKIEEIMFEEIHHKLRKNKRNGITYLETVYWFVSTYGITSITEDAFIKEYYRLRRNENNRRKKEEKKQHI